MLRRKILIGICGVCCSATAVCETPEETKPSSTRPINVKLEEVHIWGDKNSSQTLYIAPTSRVSAAQMESINLTTIEDAVVYEPGLIIRKRFIGDANGVIGMRNANMFQSTRSSVYADGLPLHYHLQTRWNGAPRWSLVAPDEVESVEIIYGPFSAAYSGNSMGGVVNIKTRTPTERKVSVKGAFFNQFYDRLEHDDNYQGGRYSLSYGEQLGDLTVFAFYNHLENEGHPQTHFYSAPAQTDNTPEVSGAISGVDSYNDPAIYYGDSGTDEAVTDLLKLKLGYEWQQYQWRLTVAHEDRESYQQPRNFVVDEDGNSVWRGDVNSDGVVFNINPGRFAVSDQNRRSLLVGSGVSGPLGGNWTFDLNLSDFRIIEDESRNSGISPDDPLSSNGGRVTEYDDTGWRTFDLNIGTDTLTDKISLVMGLQQSDYRLGLYDYNSENYRAGEKNSLRTASGGETITRAAFIQTGWRLTDRADIALGARYEQWRAENGFIGNENEMERHPDREESGFSPKFSAGYVIADNWLLRYSLARALRFPIVEELYQNVSSTTSVTEGDVSLKPEDGIFHNLLLEKTLQSGYVRLNLFHDVIDDAIYAHRGRLGDIDLNTFLSVDEVTTNGAELALNIDGFVTSNTNIKFNLAYTDAEITENRFNPSYVGKQFPRMPKWRSNLLLSWRFGDGFDFSTGLRYASNSYGELDNSDTAKEVYGAQDDYLLVNVKAGWQINKHANVALGIDNINNDVAYVAHPWPARTLYLEAGYDF